MEKEGNVRILFFSDLHANNFKAYSFLLSNGRNNRLQHAVDIIYEIKRLAKSQKCDAVLFGGDLFHIRPGMGSMSISVFNAVFEAIANLRLGINFVGLLVGNHDQGDRSGLEHSIFAFQSIVTVMDKPEWHKIKDIKILSLPAHSDKKYLKNQLDTLINEDQDNSKKILLGHLGIDGAKVNESFILNDDQKLSVADLHPDYFTQVFLGDYHQPQSLRSNVHYIGATHHHNWGDANSDRGCLIYDTETNEIERFELESAPKFVSIPFEKLKKDNLENIFGNYVRVTSKKVIKQNIIEKWQVFLMQNGALDVPEFIEQIEALDYETTNSSKFNPTMGHQEMIESYVEDEVSENLDKKFLISMGLSILGEALTRYEE